jgi:hypothetical protein
MGLTAVEINVDLVNPEAIVAQAQSDRCFVTHNLGRLGAMMPRETYRTPRLRTHV